jgi:hypothetical protein
MVHYESYKSASGTVFIRATIAACKIDRQIISVPKNQWGDPPYGQTPCLPCDVVGSDNGGCWELSVPQGTPTDLVPGGAPRLGNFMKVTYTDPDFTGRIFLTAQGGQCQVFLPPPND